MIYYELRKEKDGGGVMGFSRTRKQTRWLSTALRGLGKSVFLDSHCNVVSNFSWKKVCFHR